MAKLHIEIRPEEKATVLQAIKKTEGQVIAVSGIAKEAKMNPHRVRFVVQELLEENKIKRIVAKAFNERYIRYKYKVL